MYYDVSRDFALIRIGKVDRNHVPLKVIEHIHLWEVLLIAVCVRQTSLHHEHMIHSSHYVIRVDRSVLQVVLIYVKWINGAYIHVISLV